MQLLLKHGYNVAASASEYLMNKSGKKLYTAEGPAKSYRALFINDSPITEEILMAVVSSENLGVLHHANWKWTSPTYGNRFSMTRPFINTFLQLDGTPYTERPGWETETFYEECQNRDYRLSQTIRTPGYSRDGELTAQTLLVILIPVINRSSFVWMERNMIMQR